jgi:two-component system, response regulator / RNA-binding antiterminator
MSYASNASTDIASNDNSARWRVALLGARGGALVDLRHAVTAAGGDVVIEAPPRPDSVPRLAGAAPNVLILHPRSSSRPLDLRPFTSGGRPVVLFTRDTSRAALDVAAQAGVAALLFQPLQPAQLPPTLDLAIARFADCERLRQTLADRKVIERAKGRVMALAHLSEDLAFRWLRNRAMDTRVTLADVARSVLASTDSASSDIDWPTAGGRTAAAVRPARPSAMGRTPAGSASIGG